jgi:hypothetical protein
VTLLTKQFAAFAQNESDPSLLLFTQQMAVQPPADRSTCLFFRETGWWLHSKMATLRRAAVEFKTRDVFQGSKIDETRDTFQAQQPFTP